MRVQAGWLWPWPNASCWEESDRAADDCAGNVELFLLEEGERLEVPRLTLRVRTSGLQSA